ncbi:MAG: hypothetical protein WC505_06040 [Patescibacteria group bacterium]
MTREMKKKRTRERKALAAEIFSERESCFITTTDEFCPNFPGNTVRLTWARMWPRAEEPTARRYHVSVWGDDDMGMELYPADKSQAKQVYRDLIALQPISIDYLKSIGFVWA